MSNALQIKDLTKYLKDNQPVDTKELLNFYQRYNPNLPISTLRWRIYELKQQGVIYSPKRGLYALNEKKIFNPEPTEEMNKLASLLQERFPYVKFSLYPTNWIGNFSNHFYISDNTIIEIDADVLDATFYFLKEKFNHIFLSPKQEMYDYYISPEKKNIIVTRLYVDAPLNKVNKNYHIPKLEKLLIDLLINDPIILPISRSEINSIVENALDIYNINFSTLNRYAEKRNAKKALNQIHLIRSYKKDDT